MMIMMIMMIIPMITDKIREIILVYISINNCSFYKWNIDNKIDKINTKKERERCT